MKKHRRPRLVQVRAVAGAVLVVLPCIAEGQTGCLPHRTLTPLAHFDVDTTPEDLAVTPNGRVAIVRGHGLDGNPVLAFDLVNGTLVSITGTYSGRGDHLHDCDVVEVTDTRAITTGSRASIGPSEDRTFVDIFAITVDPVTVSVLRSYTLTNGGEVHDVTITPDGTKAIVTSANRIRVFDLVTPGLAPMADLPAIGTAPRWAFNDANQVPWTDVSADSVHATDEFAVVQYAYTYGQGCSVPKPFVYIVDLLSDPPALLLADGLGPFLPAGCFEYWPHDISISPDGEKVVAGGVGSLAFYDLFAPFEHSQLFTRNDGARAGGLFQTIAQTMPGPPLINFGSAVDSVVMSDEYLVTLADGTSLGGPPGTVGGVLVYQYDDNQRTWAQTPVLTIPTNEGAHDLEMLGNGEKAVARTRRKVYVIDLTATPPTYDAIPDFAGCDPRGSPSAFVSDSLVMTRLPARCVSITTNPAHPVLGPAGAIRVVNTNNGTIVHTQIVPLDDPTDRLVDLVVRANFCFVRGSNGGADLVGINTCGGQLMGAYDLLGECWGVDHIDATEARVITVSTNPSPAAGIRGYVDIYQY